MTENANNYCGPGWYIWHAYFHHYLWFRFLRFTEVRNFSITSGFYKESCFCYAHGLKEFRNRAMLLLLEGHVCVLFWLNLGKAAEGITGRNSVFCLFPGVVFRGSPPCLWRRYLYPRKGKAGLGPQAAGWCGRCHHSGTWQDLQGPAAGDWAGTQEELPPVLSFVIPLQDMEVFPGPLDSERCGGGKWGHMFLIPADWEDPQEDLGLFWLGIKASSWHCLECLKRSSGIYLFIC